jgi:hypothetical protein
MMDEKGGKAPSRRWANQWIKDRAVQTGELLLDGHTLAWWMVENGAQAGGVMSKGIPDIDGLPRFKAGFNGYVVFPKDFPLNLEGVDQWDVEVHGGATYMHDDEVGLVVGFDTMHSFSIEGEISDTKWVLGEITAMAKSVIALAKETPSGDK